MIARILIAAACLAAPAAASAANFFFSIDTQTDGNGNGTRDVTAVEGFLGTPEVQRYGTVIPTADGGEASFTDFQGTTWLGSGGSGTPGHSLVWNPGSTGNRMELMFSMTGLEDFSVRLGIRSAEQAGGTAPISFSSFTYDIGAGPVAAPGIDLSVIQDNQFHAWTADLSGVSAVNNAPLVTLTWHFEDLAATPAESFRIDNIHGTATVIPEPSVSLFALGGLAGWALRRSRGRLHIIRA